MQDSKALILCDNTMSTDTSDADYVCTLDERSIQVAKDELNEDPKVRLGAVQALRNWALEQNWLKTPTDHMKREFKRPEIRDFIKKINSPEYGVDLELKPKKEDILAESFRKLNTD